MSNQPQEVSAEEPREEITEDLTEVLPGEILSFSNYTKNKTTTLKPSKPAPQAPAVEVENPLPDLWPLVEDIDEEPTVVEEYTRPAAPAKAQGFFRRLLQIALDPHYTPDFPERVKKYFQEKRAKLRKDRETHLEMFPDTYDLKFLRYMKDAWKKLKTNMPEGYEKYEAEANEEPKEE